jgi:hypothetical protein
MEVKNVALKTSSSCEGTEGSNPSSSSGESGELRNLGGSCPRGWCKSGGGFALSGGFTACAAGRRNHQ